MDLKCGDSDMKFHQKKLTTLKYHGEVMIFVFKTKSVHVRTCTLRRSKTCFYAFLVRAISKCVSRNKIPTYRCHIY